MMYKKVMLLMVSLAALSGCTSNGGYGNYAAAPVHLNQKMAQDTVAQLLTLYPPAQTHLCLKQPIQDTYGATLVVALRAKGYSLMEYTTPKRTRRPQASVVAAAPHPDLRYLDLHYIVDAPKSTDLYRVTLQIGNQSISRVFTLTPEGKLYPASAWIRKE
ncbi:conjugal transfer protein TrbH [Candidatus Fukatsuia symbiotica]|nr:conjugal transfer protein TrbH [Candidatus Fukatsuia symbiotica]MEA9443868.1 conjugal transfer protein TrbH [Candidatus Fukatsuia symbiotica]